MSPSLLLLLLPVCSSQVSPFLGTVMTYSPRSTSADGSVTVDVRYKLSFQTCTNVAWQCLTGDCGSESVAVNTVSVDSVDNWCQTEAASTRQVPRNAPFQLGFNGTDWVTNQNAIIASRAATLVELATRSDTGKANTSPQTTILPNLRFPSNCGRSFSLLAFDPDGDNVQCRFGNTSLSECDPCTPPSVLALSSHCTLSVLPLGTTEGSQTYAVQIVMEDFPKQNITLTQTDGSQTSFTPSDRISKIPVQFLLQVDPPAPSCTSGLYIPLFLPPTPANGAQLYTPVNQTLQINITAQANVSAISDLLVSGPYNAIQNTSGPGQFTLRWTPSQSEGGESFPICFIVRAFSNSTNYQSEFRCVIVSVGNDPSLSTPAPSATEASTASSPAATPPVTIDTGSITDTPAPLINGTTPHRGNTTEAPPPNNFTVISATPSTASTPSASSSLTYVIGLSMRVSSATSLSGGDLAASVQQVQQLLVSLGLPNNTTVRFVSGALQ